MSADISAESIDRYSVDRCLKYTWSRKDTFLSSGKFVPIIFFLLITTTLSDAALHCSSPGFSSPICEGWSNHEPLSQPRSQGLSPSRPLERERERETLVWSGHVRPKIWDVAKKRIVGGAFKFTFWLHSAQGRAESITSLRNMLSAN